VMALKSEYTFTLTLALLALTPLLVQLPTAYAENGQKSFIRIDFERVKALRSMQLTVKITFENLSHVEDVNAYEGQLIAVSAVFSTQLVEGDFTISLMNRADNSTVFEAHGELRGNGTRIVDSNYNEELLEIDPEDSSIAVSVGSVSADFLFKAVALREFKYIVEFRVEDSVKLVTVEGKRFNASIFIENMPPTVRFNATVKMQTNETVASISGMLDFVKGIGLNVSSNYQPPITYLNLTVLRRKSVAVSRIPNTQIVKVPVKPIPLVYPTEPVVFSFGTPPSEEAEQPKPGGGTEGEDHLKGAGDLLKSAYNLFLKMLNNNLFVILLIVLVLFSAVVIAKRVIG
jgi:hypothetical protein